MTKEDQYENLYHNIDIERRAKEESDKASKKLKDDEMFEHFDVESYDNGFYCGYIKGASDQRMIDLSGPSQDKPSLSMLSKEQIERQAEDSWLWFLYDNADKDEVHDKDSYIQAFKDAVEWIKLRTLIKS